MKIYRYMSMEEFNSMATWKTMFPRRKHLEARTNSEGFCFFGEETCFEIEYEKSIYDENDEIIDEVFCTETIKYTPEKCIQFLAGIVCEDILVEFEVDESLLTVSEGVYCNPINQDDWMTITEYCTPTYSRDDFVPLRYGFVDFWERKTEWYEFR